MSPTLTNASPAFFTSDSQKILVISAFSCMGTHSSTQTEKTSDHPHSVYTRPHTHTTDRTWKFLLNRPWRTLVNLTGSSMIRRAQDSTRKVACSFCETHGDKTRTKLNCKASAYLSPQPQEDYPS